MPRPLRICYTGAIYHVMIRGNNKQRIFMSKDDMEDFCKLMQIGVNKYGHSILAFCLMPNHVHLLIKSGFADISKILHNLCFRYAARHNYFYNGVGHVFQDRFKSLLIENEAYLKNVLRYIHLNPVAANIVDKPEDYKWSSYRAYLGRPVFPWLDTEYLCQFFNPDDKPDALKMIIDFTSEGLAIPKKQMTDHALLEELYANQAEKQKQQPSRPHTESVIAGLRNQKQTTLSQLKKIQLDDVLYIVCNKLNVCSKQLMQGQLIKTRMTRLAECLVAKFVRDFVSNFKVASLAEIWGITANSLYVRIHRLEKKAETDEKLNNLLHQLVHNLQQHKLTQHIS